MQGSRRRDGDPPDEGRAGVPTTVHAPRDCAWSNSQVIGSQAVAFLRPSNNAEGVRQLCSFVQAVRIDELIAPHLTPALPKDELSALMPAEGV
jgi:hypothetical protein